MNVQALAEEERKDQQVTDALEKLAEEIKVIDLKKEAFVPKSPIFKLGSIQKEVQLKPPGVNFFSKINLNRYDPDTLIWKTKELEKLSISFISKSDWKRLISSGLLLQESSPRTVCYMTRFLFHTMTSTVDDSLRYQAYNTLCHLVQVLDYSHQLHLDFYLALDNLGADMSMVGQDISKIQRAIIPSHGNTPSERLDLAQLKDTLRLMLQFLSMVLAKNTRCEEQKRLSVNELNCLISILIALGLDTKFVEGGLDHHIANCISHCLDSYPNEIKFNESMQHVAEWVVTYCSGEPHNVSYVCCRHVLPSSRGCIFKASLAFLQLQVCLQSENKIELDIVELEDVARVVQERQQFLLAEKNGYVLYFIIKLLDCCVYKEGMSDAEKEELFRVLNLLDVVVAGVRDNVDDLNLTYFRFYSFKVFDKWRRKMGLVESRYPELS